VQLEGKVALVTGGGTGIGAATVRRFAAEGARVVLLGPEPEPLEATANEVGGVPVVGDAANAADAKRAVQAAAELGGLDVVVTCAGGEGFGALLDLDDETWERHVRLNLTTAVVTIREALPALMERGGGSIVVVSSVAGLTAASSLVTYTTAKTGLLGLVRSLAVDYGPQGVRANAVCPGATRTRMFEPILGVYAQTHGTSVEEAETRMNRVVPLRRMADPAEIAAVCLFLASGESSFVTGSVLVADGGQSAVNVGILPLVAD
jgi:meso-butanediol dehydrogenase/(S,S)-butanediol dehydrogenase/diacetyl reductase